MFQLHDNRNLHPLAIAIDYRASIKDSVVIFNQRLSPSDPTPGESWPWRYAKTCAQSSDWTVHEMTVHLTNTRLIQEAIIVASHRCIPFDNVIYQLLQPHWFRTLSRNAALRETLVPQIVLDLVAYTQDQAFNFIQHAYHNFDFQGKYVPRDLHRCGFRPEDLDGPRFRNCAYARNINLMWGTIRKFVSSMIALQYKSDAQVAGDQRIKEWCRETKADDGGQIRTFPTITTFKQLVDAVTVCIHIASPQHSAVNYLQSFYQAFVINKPPCLFQPLPTTLEDVLAVDEQLLVKSLPIGHRRYWLLAAHILWLLSFRPAEDNNLINYAASLWNLYKKKGNKEKGPQITEIAKTFCEDLRGLIVAFEAQSKRMGQKERMIPYRVLDPRGTAASALI